jgi:hypothetical protein
MTRITVSAVLIFSLAISIHAQSEFTPQALLRPKFTGLYSIPPNLDARAGYDMLGARAGINIVFTPGFKPEAAVPLRIEGQTFFEAMDRYSQQTQNFWFAWDNKTVIVSPDTQAARRDLEPLIFKIFYLDTGVRDEVLANIANTVRTSLQMRGLYFSPSAKAITIQASPSIMAEAERMIAEMSLQSLPLSSSAPLRFSSTNWTFLSIAESGRVRRVVPVTESHMENMLKDAVSIDMNQSPAAIYENLALMAGMNVIIDRAVRELPTSRFHVEGLDLINALDLLGMQTSTFWLPLNESTIHVMRDTQQNRRDHNRMQVKVIYLPEMATTNAVNETMNLLRAGFSLRAIYQNEKHKAIVIKDTPLRIFVAEKTAADLTKKLGKTTSTTISIGGASLLAENGWVLSNAANARPQLEVKLRSRTTIRLNDTPKSIFAELADLAGLKLSDNSAIKEEPEIPFNLYSVDILDAIDLFAFQTGHFWQVVDEHTIRVIPDTRQMRQSLEPMIDKTIYPADTSQTGATALLNILRTTFALRQVFLNDKNGIEIHDTAENVTLVEKLVELLGTAERSTDPPAPTAPR